MKNMGKITMATIVAAGLLIAGCGPNDDKGSMDQKNSNGEGAVDSTKIPKFDSSHASLSAPNYRNHANEKNNSVKRNLHFNKHPQNVI